MGLGLPLKNAEDRMEILNYISGVNFTFKISDLDKENIDRIAKEALEKYLLEREKKENTEKNY